MANFQDIFAATKGAYQRGLQAQRPQPSMPPKQQQTPQQNRDYYLRTGQFPQGGQGAYPQGSPGANEMQQRLSQYSQGGQRTAVQPSSMPAYGTGGGYQPPNINVGQPNYGQYGSYGPSYSYGSQAPPTMQAYNPMQNYNSSFGGAMADRWGQALGGAQSQFQAPSFSNVWNYGNQMSQAPQQAIGGLLGGLQQGQQSLQGAIQQPTAYDSQYQAALQQLQSMGPNDPNLGEARRQVQALGDRQQQIYSERAAGLGSASFGGYYGQQPQYQQQFSPYVQWRGPEVTHWSSLQR